VAGPSTTSTRFSSAAAASCRRTRSRCGASAPIARTAAGIASKHSATACSRRSPRSRPAWGTQRCPGTRVANGASGGQKAQVRGRWTEDSRPARSRTNASDRRAAAVAPMRAASLVLTDPADGYLAITRPRARRGPEPLDVGDDGVDLVIAQHPLEGLHHRAGLTLSDHRTELRGGASLPELRVPEVPRPWLQGGRRRTVAATVVAVTGRAA